MNLNDIFTNTQVLSVLATTAAALALAGLNVLALKYGFAKPLAEALLWFRANQPALVARVDEPTDDLNIRLEGLTGISREVWAKALPVLIQAAERGVEALPLGEKSPDDALPLPDVETLTQ